jgi:hypothetical protein
MHFLVERDAKRLRHTGFDLTAALHRIDDAAGAGGVPAAPDLGCAGVFGDRAPCRQFRARLAVRFRQ